MPRAKGVKQVAANRKALHDYFVLERFEAGVELFAIATILMVLTFLINMAANFAGRKLKK